VPDMGSFKGAVHGAINARRLADTCLTIPLYPALTDAEAAYIVQTVRKFFAA
jgi:dTDP-4-amino-4,6-dideoxygalactose transaminase